MRRAFLSLAFALSACATPESGERDEYGMYAPPGSRVCEETLVFESEEQRVRFMTVNAARIIVHAAAGVAFATPDPRPRLSIVRLMESCPSGGHAQEFALHGEYTTSQIVTEAGPVFARMTEAAFAAVDVSNTEPRRCVVRSVRVEASDAVGISERLTFAGLRRVHLFGADEMVFVAGDEGCAVLASYVSAAFVDMHGRTPELTTCPNASFTTCGYRPEEP